MDPWPPEAEEVVSPEALLYRLTVWLSKSQISSAEDEASNS